MLDRRSRRRVLALAASALMMVGAAGAFVAGQGPRAAALQTALGSRVETGLSPACLLVPQDQGCEHGIIS
jgi:hypothetical protein